jgi:predicted NACHT family NTPase
MTTNRQFSLALEALAELKTDASTPPASRSPTPVAPTLSEILEEIGPLPREALLLGMASDGLPILLNLYDPHPGPILVTGEAGAGKTVFLQTVARSAIQTHEAHDLQYGVITSHVDEWESVEETPHGVGVFPVDHANARDLILSLASWAHTNKNTRQSVLLLVDGLEEIASLETDAVQSFRWLLLRGPSRRVWPIITMRAEGFEQIISWLQNFRTRIFGRITDEGIASALGADKNSGLNQLEARIQFSLPENGKWLRFWLPSC